MFNPYYYNAKVLEVYDGDTVTVDVDFGFSIRMEMRIRLYGIDTPELRGDERPDGLVSRNYLREMILGKDIILETIKDSIRIFNLAEGKYGRILGIIHFNGLNVNEHLINEGLAKKYGE